MNSSEYIDGWRGVCVAMGLAKPSQRAVCAALTAGAISYMLKFPGRAFREDGSMRPLDSLSMAPDAATFTNHYLLTPALVGGLVFLAT